MKDLYYRSAFPLSFSQIPTYLIKNSQHKQSVGVTACGV